MNDVWLKMVQFLRALKGENVKKKIYVRTLEYEKVLETWKETEQKWVTFLKTLFEGCGENKGILEGLCF